MALTTVHTQIAPSAQDGTQAAPRRIEGIAASPAEPATGSRSDDHPGRWLGGAIGAVVSLGAAAIASQVAPDRGAMESLALDWTMVGLMGIPIGFLLGRHLFPLLRSDGWLRAGSVGLLLGWIAPPLGAVEVLAFSGLLAAGSNEPSILGGFSALVLLPIAVPVSFVAVVMTLPVGIVWAVVGRLAPESLLAALRVPAWLARIGVRHVVLVATPILIAIDIARPALI